MRSIIDRDSVEFVNVPVLAPAGVTLGAQAVAIAVVPRGQRPVDGDYRAATWAGNTARVLVGPGHLALAPGVYAVFVRVNDTPEVPRIPAGTITVT